MVQGCRARHFALARCDAVGRRVDALGIVSTSLSQQTFSQPVRTRAAATTWPMRWGDRLTCSNALQPTVSTETEHPTQDRVCACSGRLADLPGALCPIGRRPGGDSCRAAWPGLDGADPARPRAATLTLVASTPAKTAPTCTLDQDDTTTASSPSPARRRYEPSAGAERCRPGGSARPAIGAAPLQQPQRCPRTGSSPTISPRTATRPPLDTRCRKRRRTPGQPCRTRAKVPQQVDGAPEETQLGSELANAVLRLGRLRVLRVPQPVAFVAVDLVLTDRGSGRRRW